MGIDCFFFKMESKEVVESKNQPIAFDFGEKKKKKKKRTERKVEFIDGTGEVWQADKKYDYSLLLMRIDGQIQEKYPNISSSKPLTIKPPNITRVGSRRVAWSNFGEICQSLNRQADHIHSFVLS